MPSYLRCCALCLLSVGSLLAAAVPAAAQASTGGLRGTVRDDSGGVLIGVTVEASSPARIGGAAVGVTDSAGLYRFDNLPIGTYTVSFSLQGFTTLKREGIRVEVGRSLELSAVLTVGAVGESVTVTGDAPVVDTVHSGYTSNFNQQLLENVPSTRTSWFDAVTAAPAVRSDPVSANSATFLLYGSSGDQNSYQNDGVEVAAPSGGTVWSFPNPDTIQEIQVVGVGASAEFSGFQGGVVNIVTKSGSNAVKGSASYFYGGDQLTGNNTPDEEFAYNIDYQRDATFSLGGPIRKDRLWAIGMLELTSNRSSDIGVDPESAPRNYNYKPFGKVTFKFGQHDFGEVQYSDEYFNLPESPDIENPVETIQDENGRNPIIVARWNRVIGSRTFFEVKGGGIYIRDHFDPHSGDFTTPGRTDSGTGIASVNTSSTITKQTQNQTSISATLSHVKDHFVSGSHELKTGFQYSSGTNLVNGALAGGASYSDFNGEPDRATFRETSATIGRVKTAGIFVQDNWTIVPRLTLNLGLRFDRSVGDIPETDKLDSSFTDKLGTYPGISDVITYDNWSPRVGAAFKLDDAGKTVVKTSYGRYFARLNTGLFTSIAPGGAVSSTYGYNPATGEYDILQSTTNPKLTATIDPGLENELVDQFFIGIERQLLPDLGVNASFIVKRERNFIRGRDFGSAYVPRDITETFADVSQTLTIFNRISPAGDARIGPTNRDDFRQKYNSLVLQAYKRLSNRWQLQGSYQWEVSEGFSTASVSSSQSGPGTFGADPNQLVNAYGRFPTDSTHSFRVSSTVELPWNLSFAVREVFESGRPYGRTITVRGLSQGNATVIAQPRGSFELPSRNDLGIRVGRDVPMPAGRLLRLSLDVQNLFNNATPLSVAINSSQSTYGQTTNISLPRRALLGIRFSF
ncbi:MAG: TonB-dependent receptor [Acidobacteria bacterium]|nr:TonB-dependent receptor [Acidobacteriota bacterium]